MNNPAIGVVLNTIGFGGVTEVAYHLARHVSAAGFDVRICVLKKSGKEGAARLARFHDLGVPIHFATGGAGKFDIIAAVASWIEVSKVQILHTHSFRPNLYARMAGVMRRDSGLRLIAHYHNQYDDKWDVEPSLLALERHMVTSTDAMIAVSHSVRRHVADRLGVSDSIIDVVPNGVDAGQFANGERAGTRLELGLEPFHVAFGLIGRICEQKGQDIFVAAAIDLARKHPDARFLVIGDAEDESLTDRLKQSAAAHGFAEVFRFTGHRSDMARIYAALDVVVAPSRWEGFGLMLVEAMAAGKPIIAADVGGISEVAGSSGAVRLIPPDNSTALTEAMETLAQNRNAWTEMAAAGRERQRDFTWEKASARLASIYRRVLQESRVR